MKRFCWLAGVLLAVSHCIAQEIHEEQPAKTHSVDKDGPGKVVVKEFLIDSPLDDIQWAGQKKKIVFVRSMRGTIYRSTDDGKTWQHEMEKLEGSLSFEFEGQTGVADIIVSEANSNYIFFQGFGDRHWMTTDGGESYRALGQPMTIKQVVLHKTMPERLLISRWSNGCNEAVKENCHVEVHLSLDLGQTFTFLTNYVAQFSWGRPHHVDEIFIVRFDNETGNQRFGAWDKNAHFYTSSDLFKTSSQEVPGGNRFLILGDYVFVAMVDPMFDNQVRLSIGKGDTLMYRIGRLPFDLKEHSYTILDTSEGSVFLHANHGNFYTPFGDLYTSDSDGGRYSLSLKNNRRDPQGRCDFEKVKGIAGVYIANSIENPEFVDTYTEVEHVVTSMTFNKGGKWERLSAPTHDSTGQELSCVREEGCSLHLHGVTDEYGPFYSAESALGLVMATGNIGRWLSMEGHETSINTYFSRDAGKTWYEVRKGSHIYEFGDHGGLIVMAKDRSSTKEVLYTWSEGLSWKSVPLPGLTDVENIITEPNSTRPTFVLYGSRNDVGVLVHLDFSELHTKLCQGVEAAGNRESAYELWTPSDTSTKCLLGHQVHFTRRKRGEECFNGEEHERQSFVHNCPCAESDYECDFGYERATPLSECKAVEVAAPDQIPKKCPRSGHYFIPNGYRYVAGTLCDPTTGLDKRQTRVNCGGFSSVTKKGGWSLTMVFILCALLFAATYLKKDTETMEWLRSLVTRQSFKYKPVSLGLKDEYLSDPEDEDFAIGEMLEEAETRVDSYEEGASGFGPLPMPSSDFSETQVPALQPPPTEGETAQTDQNVEDVLFSGS